MPTPTRLLVLQRLGAVIENTSWPTEEDLDATLQNKVFRGRNLSGEEDKPWPIVSIIEAPRPDIGVYAGEDMFMRQDRWTLLINGIILDDKLHPTDAAYHLCAAVEMSLGRIIAKKPGSGRPLYPDEHMLGDLISSFEIAPPVIRPPSDKASAAAFFFLPVRVGIATPVGQPYTPVP